MKKILIIIHLLFSIVIYSLEVDREIIELDLEISVEFENYIGPYLFYNSIEDIRNIGAYLAKEIEPTIKGDANYNDKYLLFHRPKIEWEENKKSVDILEITDRALIDNVNNIELIISQYLMDNYGYLLEDADLLAHLIVIYNAVYRGNIDHLSSVYSSETIIPNNTEFIGLDLQYQNWPGKTYIYIPLSNDINIGSLTNVDSDILIDDSVIEQIKLDDEKEIELREDIIDFKEREFDEIAEKSKDIELKINNIEETTTKTEDSETVIDENIEITNNELDEVKKLEDIRQSIESTLEQKESQILELRDELAEDKNNIIIKKQETSSVDEYLFFITKIVNKENFGQLVYINNEGNITKRSEVNSIRNRNFITIEESIFFIAGGDGDNQIITIGKASTKSLDLVSWGTVPVYKNSLIIFNKDRLYTIIKVEDDFYIGEFDLELNLLRRSPASVIEDSYLLLKKDIFYIQGKYNSIKLVNLSDFVTISE